MRRALKSRLARLEKQSVSPKFEVLWVDVHSGETHEGVIKAKYGDQIPPGVEPVTVSWMPPAVSSRMSCVLPDSIQRHPNRTPGIWHRGNPRFREYGRERCRAGAR